MPDRFIDLDETQIYGPHASKMIRERILGLIPEFDSAMGRVADDIDHATLAIHEAIEIARDATAQIRVTAREKGTVLQRAKSLLGRFSKHLDAHEKGEVDRKRFFPEDGTAGGVGTGAPRVAIALARISSLLAHSDTPVRARDEWLKEFKSAIKSLTPLLEHSNNARTERAEASPELNTARLAWVQIYAASKCGVECVLRLTGNLHLMPVVFYDLSVPNNGGITNIPEAPKPASPG